MDVLLLSEGMKRRVALSLSFLGNPDILLLDEPLENLDKEIKEDLLEFVQIALKDGKTILVATHEIDAFRRFTPRAINLDMGVQD